MPQPSLAVVVLAAGAGTRMRSRLPKVLHPVGGRSMIGHVCTAALGLEPDRLVVVVGHEREQVAAGVGEVAPGAVLVTQERQLGTGHAVQVALDGVGDAETVVVVFGDTPLLETATLAALVDEHRAAGHAATVLTAIVDDPTGYGRVLRDPDDPDRVVGSREHKDASGPELAITEINSGVYAFDRAYLADALTRVGTDNAQGEVYLPDVLALAVGDGRTVGARVSDDAVQVQGANDLVQLADLGAELNRRTLRRWMRAGVTIVDPTSTWVDSDVELAPDARLLPGVQLHGATTIGPGAVVGPDSTLTDVEVGPDAAVVRTHAVGPVRIGAGASVGPYAYLRPGSRLDDGSKVGTFVETKNSHLATGAKVPHLSYVGDASVGEGTNIGAGTIVANYDGVHKHRTVVGRDARTGSHNVFVAPVEIGDGAYTGAGTVVRGDVPPGALSVPEAGQRVIEGWVARRRPGTAAAGAAAASGPDPQDEPDQSGA